MTTILKNVKTVNNTSPGYGAVPTTATPLSGQFLTSTGTTTVPYYTTGTNTTWVSPNNEVMRINQTDPPTLEVKGKMVINGVDLEERLKTIERVLTIPERDVILEKKHPKLKKLYDEYITALGKYRTFEAIKGDENGTT